MTYILKVKWYKNTPMYYIGSTGPQEKPKDHAFREEAMAMARGQVCLGVLNLHVDVRVNGSLAVFSAGEVKPWPGLWRCRGQEQC